MAQMQQDMEIVNLEGAEGMPALKRLLGKQMTIIQSLHRATWNDINTKEWVYFTAKGKKWRVGSDPAGDNLFFEYLTSGDWKVQSNWDRQFGVISDGGIIVPKASGKGIKVDFETPTFGFADIIGDQFSKNTGATKPTLVAYNGAVQAWQFGNGDEAYMTYHIPHDYVAGTDIHLHIHWSQNNAGATGGTLDFVYTAIYAKGHNQASGSTFTSTPKTVIFSSIDINDGGGGLNQYQHHLTEVTISAATATAALFDRDDFEPDGVIELTLEMDANNLTGTPSSPFIHYADIHYQTTGVFGTKSRTPDFYT